MPHLVRITTVPVSLKVLLKGQMKFMQEQGFEVTMVSSDGPEAKDLEKQENCTHIVIPLSRKISPLQDLLSLIKLTRLLHHIQPDIVHTHTPKAGLIGMWAAFFARVPVRLHTIAGLPWMESKGPLRLLLRLIEKITALPAHQVYPNSFVLQRFLKQQGIAVNKLKVLCNGSSNGIDCTYFNKSEELANSALDIRSETGVIENAWVWIFVGRIVKDKGMGELLDAFQTLNRQFPDDRLWILGDEEPELDPLEKRHRNMLYEHVAIKNWHFQNDIRPFLAASQVLVFPSYREGFPNVPMQAGAMGCALILSDINGCNEIVTNGVDGLLVSPKSEKILLEAMLLLRNDPAKRDLFASAARKKIESGYSQENIWYSILGEYNYWLKNNCGR
jgi:glycosyltransferase involved in cell wall biosynthesis